MMTEADYYALFEDYSAGELAAPARADLEARLSADPTLALRYADFTDLTDMLRTLGQHQQVRQQLRDIHAAMLAAEVPAPAAEVPAPAVGKLTHKVHPILRISRTERKLREFWSGHRATVGVAASVAVMAVFATLLGLDIWRNSHLPTPVGYQALRREVERIKKSQKDLRLTLNTQLGKEIPPAITSKFSGTGFALTAEGYLVTSFHVIQGADSLLVEGHNHQRFHAEPVYTDVKHDLAILRITDKRFNGFGRLPYAIKSGQADLGERVFTLGYPREDVVYGEGSLSARSGFEGDTAFYQVSIPVNPGNSGGPLLDERGNLIGVVSGRQNDAQGAAFATKSSYLVRLVDSLAAKAKADAPYHLPHYGQLAGSSRPQQLKKLQDYVFVVKVYEKD